MDVFCFPPTGAWPRCARHTGRPPLSPIRARVSWRAAARPGPWPVGSAGPRTGQFWTRLLRALFPGPYSRRGERRPQAPRAARTNRPLELPVALRGKGQTSEGRRWRDLCRFYGNKLAAERLADEGTRAVLPAERSRALAGGERPATLRWSVAKLRGPLRDQLARYFTRHFARRPHA